MEYLFPSRKRLSDASSSSTTTTSSSSSSSNKRPRRLLDLTIPSSPTTEEPPPLLAQSQTFESTYSSSPLPLQSSSQHSHEYYSAISSARSRLTAAQRTLSQTATLLQSAQCHHEQSLREVQEARVYLKGVERRWGVVMLDQSDDDDDDLEEFEECGGELIGRTTSDNRGCVSGQQLQQQQADGRDEQQQATTTTTAAQSIEITSSGESLVNGIYHHSTTTTSNSSSTITSSNSSTSSNVYIHSSGPFHIHQQNYDVCLFPKVYGDKFRWCVGLVPCSAACHGVGGGRRDGVGSRSDSRSITNADEQHPEQELQQQENANNRTRDFDLVFIYYWTNDIPIPTTSSSTNIANQGEEEGMSVIPSLSVIQHWGACHGERPLPNISLGGRRWWQFWKG